MDKNILINGNTYNNISSIKVKDAETSELHTYRNTDDGDIGSFDILFGKVGYGKDGKVIGAYVPPSTVGSGETDYEEEGINFYDYYGQKIASYQLTDLPLSALPEIPALDGVGSDGYTFEWNMTLDEVNALTEPADIAVDVTANTYNTYVIPNDLGFPAKTNSLYFYGGTSTTTIKIDWGDGTIDTKTLSANRQTDCVHAYTAISFNPVVITYVSGSTFYLGNLGETATGTGQCTFMVGHGSSYSGYWSERLREIRIGKGVKGLSNRAVYEGPIEKIILPNSLTYIGMYCFSGCYKMESVNVPKSVTSIGNYALSSLYRLKYAYIPKSVTSIGTGAFQNCYVLKSIHIPKSVTSIASYTFTDCHSFTNIKLPDGVTGIGNCAFQNCYVLKSVPIPNSVTSIGQSAFQGCINLEGIKLPDGVTSIGNFAFSGARKLDLEIPESVTSIGKNAFDDCENLKSVVISNKVTSIGSYAFQDCINLGSIEIREGIAEIGAQAFYGCRSVQSIEIPESVTSIGSAAFVGCSAIKYIKMKSATPPSLASSLETYDVGQFAFKIYVPTGSMAAYSTATNWAASATRMEEY